MRKWLLCFILFLGLLFWAGEVQALRQRVRKPRAGGGGAPVSMGVTSQVRLRGDRQALLINFSNFQNLQSVSYELVYEANGIGQGVSGTIPLGDTDTKTLLFGTCSAGICTYHQNITNMRLSIISVLGSGVTVLKPYRIRI